MKIEYNNAEKPFDLSPHNHVYINPYVGCSMGCPFCYWLENEGWEGRIQVRKNVPELLEKALREWPREDLLYLGSYCDPFNEMEAACRLTHRVLEIVRDNGNPLLITSSATQPCILEEEKLFLQMKDRLIIAVELARVPEIERMHTGGEHRGIYAANRLKEMGLTVYTTLAPLCPGAIELEDILARLRPDIPVYVDKLACRPGTILAERTMGWIKKCHPERIDEYKRIIDGQDDSYFGEILERYPDRERIRLFPYDLVIHG